MADLVSVSALIDYLGEANPDQEVLVSLLDGAEALFEVECGRAHRPFGLGIASRTEVQDGTGTPELFLDYPATSLVSIKLGFDPTDPDDTLDVTDPDVVKIDPRIRQRLVRTDGESFGELGAPLSVQVVYATADDVPNDASIAVLRVAAALYNNRGAEASTAERLGSYSIDLEAIAKADPVWQAAVAAHREVHV